MSVFDQVKKIIVAKIGVLPENVTMKSSMANDFGCDDLDVAELIMSIEQEFEISIPDEYSENFKTVKDIVDYINKTKGEQ
jgi:acyl carrier protein